MKKCFNRLPLFLLIIFQVLPVVIVVFFLSGKNQITENAGWITEKEGNCKYFTGQNYENRAFTWEGDCIDGLVSGFGKLRVYENGIEYYVFEGFTVNGKIEGQGKMTFLSDGDTFEGNYLDGRPHGQGHFYNDDGDHYEGNYKYGQRSGIGTYWYPPKSDLFKFTGQWENNVENGKGTLYYRNGKKVTGIFINGVLEKTDHQD